MENLGATASNVSLLDTIKVGGVLTAVLVLVGTWFAVRIVVGTLDSLGKRFVSKRLVLAQVSTLIRFTMYFAGFAIAIAVSVELSKEVILALTGTAAVTIGFALKDLAASVLAGITIIIDRPFQVGDRVTFGGYYGEIKSIGLRSVRLVTLDDNVVTIPNNKFLTEAVASGNLGALDMLIMMDFFVGVDQDIALAKRLISEAITSTRYAYLKKWWVVGSSHTMKGDRFVICLRALVYVLDVQYEKALESDVTERVMAAFREHGIEMPPLDVRMTNDNLQLAGRGILGNATN